MADSGQIGGAGSHLLRASLARSGKWAGAVGVVGGFIADILQPLAPFAALIALIAAIAALIVAIAIAFRLVLAAKAMPALVFATTTAAIAGGVYALQKASDAQDGLLAGLVPAVAELQQSMGIVVARVGEIQKTVEETQKTVVDTQTSVDEVQKTAESVEKTTQEIAASQQKSIEQTEQLQTTTEQIAQSIEKIADGFAALSTQGGIIADPQRPDQFYHNARAYELSGDMVNARRSYLAFANFDIDAVDPYTRFATLLRVQDGRAGAREVFGTLAEKSQARSVKLVHILQFEDAQRLPRLQAFIASEPDYAPAYYLLSQEYSEDRLGAQSLADKRAEAAALTKFVSYEADGGLLKYFIDQTQLADWLDASRRRLASLGNVLDPALFAPKLVPQRSNQGWIVTVTLPEPATGISWRMGTEGPYVETGFLAMNDQTTGKPMPNPSFSIADDAKADMISLKYLDIRGQETGPYDIRFDPDAALAEGNRQVLDQFWTSWIAFDASGNTGLVYYTQLLSYRCGIEEARYSLNGETLDKTLELPPCNAKDPFALPDNTMPFFKIGEEVKSMAVQLTYVDGTKSPVRVFNR